MSGIQDNIAELLQSLKTSQQRADEAESRVAMAQADSKEKAEFAEKISALETKLADERTTFQKLIDQASEVRKSMNDELE